MSETTSNVITDSSDNNFETASVMQEDDSPVIEASVPEVQEDNAVPEVSENEETEITVPEEPVWKWTIEPTFDYDYAGIICKGHTSFDFFTADYLDYNTVWYSNLCVYGKGELFGITDYEGNILTPPEYREIRVGVGEKCILEDANYQCRDISRDGTLSPLVSGEYYQEVTNGWPFICWSKEEHRLVGMNDGEEYSDRIKPLTAYPVQEATKHDDGNYIWYETDWQNGKYALVTNNELITDFIYEDAGRLHEGIIPVKKDGKWGYVDQNGNTVIDFAYDDAWERNRSMLIYDENGHYTDWTAFDATDGTVVLCQNGQYALYSVDGEPIIPFGELEEISPLYQGKAWAKSGGLWGVIEVSPDKIQMSEISDIPVSEGLTEEQLYNQAQNMGTVAAFTCADFDGNNRKEAFFILIKDQDVIDSVCFIDSSGNTTFMPEGYNGLSYYQSNNGYYEEYQGKGFFYCDYGAYGSGWSTMLYSVKDNIPYQLDIAPELQGFYHEGDRFYTTINEFSAGYHESYEFDLVYDSTSQQFRFQ